MERSADAPGVLEGSGIGSQKDRVVTEGEWLRKWETGNIGFHKERGHPYVASLSCLVCSEKPCEMNGSSFKRYIILNGAFTKGKTFNTGTKVNTHIFVTNICQKRAEKREDLNELTTLTLESGFKL